MYELLFKPCSNTIFLNQILPGVKVVIANPETKGMCADSHLGEVRHVSKLKDCELFIIDFCLRFGRLKFCVQFGFTIYLRYAVI